MANDSRAVRILSDLCCALRKEKNILEFGFIYCPEPLFNKSPIVLVDGNLGIETWSIKPLYHYAHSQLFASEHRQHDLRRLSDCSVVAVLLNPECLSAWNIRKELVLKKYLNAEDDLNLARIVLTKHPKSPETFSHRRWLLQQLYPSLCSRPTKVNSSQNLHRNGPPHQQEFQERGAAETPKMLQQGAEWEHPDQAMNAELLHADNESLLSSIRAEMEVCASAAGRYPSNYNAWSHRIWIVEHLAGTLPQFLEAELRATKSWVSSHISDHSGFHYRQFLLGALTGLLPCRGPSRGGHLGTEAGLYVRLLLQELQLILDLVTSYPGHEAVWYHRRYVVHLWKALLCNGTLTEPDKITGIQGVTGSSKSTQMPILPTGNDGSTEDHLQTKSQTKRPSEDEPFENGQDEVTTCIPVGGVSHRKHVCLATDADSTTSIRTALSNEDATEERPQGQDGETLCPSDQRHSRDVLDSSLQHHPDQNETPPASHHNQRVVSVKTSSKGPLSRGSCRTDDAFSSHDILRLVQHEKRFVEIVMEGTRLGEREAQQQCALNYSHWLDNLRA